MTPENIELLIYDKVRYENGVKIKDSVIISPREFADLPDVEQATVKRAKTKVYDQHFTSYAGEEYCIRSECSGCRYIKTCSSAYDRIDLSGSPNIRKAFIARPGYSLAAIDYSGIELRVAANIAKEQVWIEAFLKDRDIHEETAKAVFKVEKPSKYQRKVAKCVTGDTVVSIARLDSGRHANSVDDVPIKELFSGIPNLEPDTFYPIEGLGALDELGNLHPVKELYYGGTQKTMKVELSCGTIIEGTPNHQIRVIDAEGEYVWKRLDELDIEVDVVVLVNLAI